MSGGLTLLAGHVEGDRAGDGRGSLSRSHVPLVGALQRRHWPAAVSHHAGTLSRESSLPVNKKQQQQNQQQQQQQQQSKSEQDQNEKQINNNKKYL